MSVFTARVSTGLRVFFPVERGGVPQAVAAGNITVTVRNPGDTASAVVVAVATTEVGLYYYDVPSAFLTTHGVGTYGALRVINQVSPTVRATKTDNVQVTVEDIDSLNTSIQLIVTKLPTGDIADQGGEVQIGVTMDPSAAPAQIRVNTWLENDVGAVPGTNLSNASVELFSQAGVSLAGPSVTAAPDAQGAFSFTFNEPGFSVGQTQTYIVATIDDGGTPSRTFTGRTGVTFSRSQ